MNAIDIFSAAIETTAVETETPAPKTRPMTQKQAKLICRTAQITKSGMVWTPTDENREEAAKLVGGWSDSPPASMVESVAIHLACRDWMFARGVGRAEISPAIAWSKRKGGARKHTWADFLAKLGIETETAPETAPEVEVEVERAPAPAPKPKAKKATARKKAAPKKKASAPAPAPAVAPEAPPAKSDTGTAQSLVGMCAALRAAGMSTDEVMAIVQACL